MKNFWFWIIVGVAVVVVIVAVIISNMIIYKGGSFLPLTDKYIGIVKIEGSIYDSRDIINQIKKYRRNDAVKGIVVRINSPGGGVSPTQEIVYELEKTRKERNIPIYCSMGSIAASGGYYIATACDEIYANPGTITGSIGVIISLADVSELIAKIGFKMNVIKSGEFKDTGSIFREMSDDERKLLEGLVDDIYNQFVEAVVEGRSDILKKKLGVNKEDKVREYILKYADGRVFSGRQAEEYGFIDELGTLSECIDACAKEAGIEGKPKVIFPKKPRGLLDILLGENTLSPIKDRLEQTPSVEYMFRIF